MPVSSGHAVHNMIHHPSLTSLLLAVADIANLLDEDAVEGGQLAYLFYCGGGSLNTHLLKLRRRKLAMNESNASLVVAQIASALQHCHALGVCHRDVKPENIVHDGRRWRLCDFGFAVRSRDTLLKEPVGSLVYCAPEILSGKGAYLGWPVDMWALGARERRTDPDPTLPHDRRTDRIPL